MCILDVICTSLRGCGKKAAVALASALALASVSCVYLWQSVLGEPHLDELSASM